MSYATIDSQISQWAKRHALALHTDTGAGFSRCETRGVYVSSKAGECFQIWVGLPKNGRVSVYAGSVEGRRENEPPQKWHGSTNDLTRTLDDAFQTVIDWMKPSERHFPP